MMTLRPALRARRSSALLGAALGLTALVATACPVTPPSDGGTTTTAAPTTTSGPTTTTASTVRTVTNATFEWTISAQANKGSNAPGEVNYWSAGRSDSTSATYTATNGNVTVLKKNAAGTFVPIGSEAAVSWANRNRDGANNVVTANNAFFLGQKVRFTGGVGTVNTATGASSIQWTGTFSVNFYGRYVPFWIVNPKLVVNASGVGTITATMGGYASSLEDPDTRTLLPDTTVTVANLSGVAGANTTGFTATPAFLGVSTTVPAGQAAQIARTTANQSYWGAWPQSFVNFQAATGLGSYWYTSGSAADVHKPVAPVTVAYQLG